MLETFKYSNPTNKFYILHRQNGRDFKISTVIYKLIIL